ncbi:hypothetical protein FRC98_11295 [Lujinxingia vulgaris]|uniref:Poly-gamma-glutamate synthase PgsB n=1 Tax=Lujinxingia vulgaris TaxID=2600176 RepID=A0A5C6XGS0_9DELT|nr:hypothetical protein [Lujinxingia vulgaris]TXD37308.1 hypothetical protein FRC98_11295 [Lujinxingia vulgaris]
MIFDNWPTSDPDSPPRLSLNGCLPALVRRLDHRALADLHTRLERQGPPTLNLPHTELLAPDPHLEPQLELSASLLDALRQLHHELHTLRTTFQTFTERYFAQLPGRARQDVVVQYLESQGRSARELRKDLRALDEFLDFETLRERQTLQESRLIARLRLIFIALEALTHDILARAHPDDRSTIAQNLLKLPGAGLLRTFAQNRDQPELQPLAIRAAHAPLAALLDQRPDALASEWLRLLIKIAILPTASSWLKIAAITTLAHSREAGLDVLVQRATRSFELPDDWHVQAHAIARLAELYPDIAREQLAQLDTTSGPDAIPIAIAKALSGDPHPDALTLLERLALPATEPRQKVRAHAARSLTTTARQGGQAAARAAAILARIVRAEPSSDVLQTTLGALLPLLRDLITTHPELAHNATSSMREILADRLELEHDAAVANRLASFRLDLAALDTGTDAADASDATATSDAPSPSTLDLAGRLSALHPGEHLRLAKPLATARLARAMALAARQGFGLYATERRTHWRVARGERYAPRLWRYLHELRHPSPNKRQGFDHTRARVYPGRLRAHPADLGEVTPTTVPGERRQVGSEGGWGGYIPLVDDLLDAQRSARPIILATTQGITTLTPPKSAAKRLKNLLKISNTYAHLDELRLASIKGDDADQRGKFLGVVEKELGCTITFRPHLADDPTPRKIRELIAATDFGRQLEAADPLPLLTTDAPSPEATTTDAPSTDQAPAPVTTSLHLLATAGPLELLTERLHTNPARHLTELFDRTGARIQELAIVLTLIVAFFLGRMLIVRHQLDRWRNDIPLSIGGWGTRGKSGTERLKAGLLHGMGYDVFVKTTGCEAMFIHAARRQEAREIFIYRPYDKASIWEQRDMLRLGRDLGADVFMWECMALNPRYVDILQSHWMRDDLITLTNAYPDHEDIQGPAGIDVARTISQFIPPGRTTITAEREMLPIFEDTARKKGAPLIVVGHDDETLIPDAQLARFPYDEHPRNIALVARMARELGIDPEYAIFAMADHVVPDLGVLKTYPRVTLLGRHLAFINGCSANERAGFMNNWTRTGLDKVDPRSEPHRKIFTVVNNRDDRIARSKVFADILVRDVICDGHILIGTNLSGLRTYMAQSLEAYLANQLVFEDNLTPDPTRAHRRLDQIISRVRLTRRSPDALITSLKHMLEVCPPLSDASISTLYTALPSLIKDLSANFTSIAHTLKNLTTHPTITTTFPSVRDTDITLINSQRSEVDPIHNLTHTDLFDARDAFLRDLAATIAAHALHHHLDAVLDKKLSADDFHHRLHTTYTERFWQIVHTVEDPATSGDGIILTAARLAAPNSTVELLGTQNIKGTGLDFVYRWVDLNNTLTRHQRLENADDNALRDELIFLATASSLGLIEALACFENLERWRASRNLSAPLRTLLDRAQSHLATLAQTRFTNALPDDQDATPDSPLTRVLAKLERSLDSFDAIYRRRKADRLQRLLVEQRISHARIALEMQKLVKRQKGGWLVKR